jgi:hypothetical protein
MGGHERSAGRLLLGRGDGGGELHRIGGTLRVHPQEAVAS